MSSEPVDIQIFGRSLRVNCPEHERAALDKAAALLNQRLHELKLKTKVANAEQLIFIAALNLCHELTQEQSRTADYATNMEQRVRLLQKTIDEALNEPELSNEQMERQSD